MSNSWTPVLRGATYCSPDCGGRCTRASYDRAVAKSIKLANRMGDGWMTRVWENLGWHYQVWSACGRLKLSEHGRRYAAYLGDAGESGGRWCAVAAGPKAAVKAVIAQARAELASIEASVAGL